MPSWGSLTAGEKTLSENECLLLLRMVPIFHHLEDAQVENLGGQLEQMNYRKGAVIFEKGDRPDSLFVVAGGRVVVRRGSVVIGHLMSGDFLGDMAVLDGEPRSATAVAESDCLLLRMRASVLFDLMRADMQFTQGIFGVLTSRIRSMMHDLEKSKA